MHTDRYLAEVGQIAALMDFHIIEQMADVLFDLRERGGRLFMLGIGGSAANCSHAVNDFRKICGIEAYTPVDNVAELTARINDDGWETVFVEWLRGSRMNRKDAVFVFSVGGGDLEKKISVNLVKAVEEAKRRGVKILGVVGRDGGYVNQIGDAVLIIPTVNSAHVTPHTEAFQAVVWHCLVSHPKLQKNPTKWESTVNRSRS